MSDQAILICQPLKKIFPDGHKEKHGFTLHFTETDKKSFYEGKNISGTNPELQPEGNSYLCVIDQSYYHDNLHQLHREYGAICLNSFCHCWLPLKYQV